MSYRHEVTEIAPRTWCLSEFRLVNAFLIEGEERAALVDTGCGIGDLAREVRELTDKPLIILLTHTHFDHDGGIYEFPGVPVYVNPLDGERIAEDRVSMVKYMGTEDYNEMRRGYIRSRGPIRCPDLDQAELLKLVPDHPTNDGYSWLPVRDGNEIDLGGRALKAIHTPGHTDGSTCFLDAENRILFSGDCANISIILTRQPGNDMKLVKICNSTMTKLWKQEASFDRLAVGHDAVTLDKQIVRDYRDLSAGLLDGTITGSYEEVGFRKGDVARLGMAELWYQCDA
jgi:hydroxyacylglutathione hydrolase